MKTGNNKIRKITGELLEIILGAESTHDIAIIETKNFLLAVNSKKERNIDWHRVGRNVGDKLDFDD